MKFLDGELLYLMILAAVAVPALAVYAARRRQAALRRLLGAGAADPEVVRLSPGRRRLRLLFLFLVMLFLILAAARPYRSTRMLPVESAGRDLAILFDVSKSMLATDLPPTRLEHAKFLARELLDACRGDRFALIPFAGNAFLACPLTSDLGAVRSYVDELSTESVPLGGTHLERAIRRAVEAFDAGARGNRAILLLTDGDELEGESAKTLALLREQGIPVFAVGFGDPAVGAPVPDGEGGFRRNAAGKLVSSRLNEAGLRQLALETGGVYFRSTVGDTGGAVLARAIRKLETAGEAREERYIPVEDFPICLALAGVFLVAYLLLSERPYRRRIAALPAFFLFPVLLTAEVRPTADEVNQAVTHRESLPQSPWILYNLGRGKQLDGDNKYAEMYERSILKSEGDSDLRSRAFHNLAAGRHRQLQEFQEKAKAQLEAQQLDPALRELEAAEAEAAAGEELYRKGLGEGPRVETGTFFGRNLQRLAADRQAIAELKRKIEELKKQQQQAKQQAEQARRENQKEEQQKQQQQQEKPADQALDQARREAEKLGGQAKELGQKELKEQAEQAAEKLEKAKEAREKGDRKEADKQLEEAVKALSGGEEKKPGEERKPGEEQKPDQPGEGEPKPGEGKPEAGKKLDPATAAQLLELMAGEEKQLRDALKRPPPGRAPQTEKDW